MEWNKKQQVAAPCLRPELSFDELENLWWWWIIASRTSESQNDWPKTLHVISIRRVIWPVLSHSHEGSNAVLCLAVYIVEEVLVSVVIFRNAEIDLEGILRYH